jgi:uncharacterized protein YbjT (DUF2867 family)
MFVILGASGKVGRTTIKQLRSQGAPVRAVVRQSSNADAVDRSTWIERRDYALLLTMLRGFARCHNDGTA